MPEFLQFLTSGLTVGAVYALVALGFTLVYNASDVVNFAQGEFVMIGGMGTVFLSAAGAPLPLAAVLAVAAAVVVGLLLHRLAIEPARGASAVTLIIITIGASIFLRGVAQVVFDKQFHKLPSFSGDAPVNVGIDTAVVMALAFGVSAAIGAVAGVLVTPITLTSYDIGVLLALKGFAAAMLGGMGNPVGAVLGGLIVGLLEAFSAGYLSSNYKDAVAFLTILLVLLVAPQGLLGRAGTERV
jgi:branched-chain amino acid transport system permease protein